MESGRNGGSYEFNTDSKATEGFLTWFNDVLIRSFIDAAPYAEAYATDPGKYLDFHQVNLDNAFEKYNVGNLLPIHLRSGWGSEVKTKPFHQFSFASEYAVLAKRLLAEAEDAAVDGVADDSVAADSTVYSLSGVKLGSYADLRSVLAPGLYIVAGKKIAIIP